MNRFIKILMLFSGIFLFAACGDDNKSNSAEFSSSRDKQLQESNLEAEESLSGPRTPCDTLSLKQHVISSYPPGTYLVDNDQTLTYNVQRPAVIYARESGSTYILAVIAKSKEGERYVEVKNIVGYEASFLNLDSTKLGTAFFYLTLFECMGDGSFNLVWEKQVPNHSGFNTIKLKTWPAKNIRYVELNFDDGIISGHRNYNFFLINGLTQPPHLMESYEGIARKRTIANVNDDKFPDFYEYRYLEGDSVLFIKVIDSIPYYWNTEKELYVTKYNRNWQRPY